MRCRGLGFWSIGLLAAAAIAALAPSVVWAQNNNGNNSAYAGVSIDANGVLHAKSYSDPDGDLRRKQIEAARTTLDPKVTAFSKLRKVSLNRLEQTILDHQGVLTDEMRCLAGLLRVRYVFYYPDSKDIVLAGPAEGWAPDPSGRIVGINTCRPVLQLQDLVVALRAFPFGKSSPQEIGCSIDPTQEGLAALKQFNRTVHLNGPPTEEQIQAIAEGIRNSLGYQNITLNGVSPKTHFAQVMVEADYRMKLIGIGLETPPVKMVSYVERAKPSESNGLRRWYFVPDYQCVRQSDDRLAMELVGDGVKLVGEDEVVGNSGERRAAAGRGSKASQAFVASFTKKYPELADRSPVYAELRNLIDLAVAAAYIQEQGFCDKAGWRMEFFGSEKAYPVETYDIPKTVESAVNVIARAGAVSFPVGGGVTMQPTKALDSGNVLPDKKGNVAKLHSELKPDLAKGQWWWD